MTNPPTGTVTFLFTDIESSTRLWEQDAPAMHKALARHDEILRDAIAWHGGYVFKTIGDAFCATFPNALDALGGCPPRRVDSLAEAWSEEIGALLREDGTSHGTRSKDRDGDYFGPPPQTGLPGCFAGQWADPTLARRAGTNQGRSVRRGRL